MQVALQPKTDLMQLILHRSDRTFEPIALAPPKEPRKLEAIEGARQQMAAALQPGPAGPASEASGLARQLEGLQLLLGMAMGREAVRAAPRVRQALSELRDAATGASTALGNAPADALPDRLARLHEHFVEWRAGARERVAAALSTRPLTLDDLPALGKREAVGEDGRLLLKIYPRGDLYEPRELEPFMTEVRKIDPLLTGTVVQIYESALLMKRSYQWAGVFAVVAVFLLVYLDFQRLADAVLCLLPVGVGFVTMFGAMWLAGFSINLANIIVLPLLFGIGVDAGVHLMHRYRVAPRDHPPGLTAGTGKGILLTGVTTMIGFSSMMLARHRGIVSLGFVVTIGVGLTLLACLTVMPAVLELRNRYHARLTRKRWEAAERRS